MQEEEYRRRLQGNKLIEDIMPVFSVLEKFIDRDMIYSLENMNYIRDSLSEDEIRNHIHQISIESRQNKNGIFSTYVNSFNRNVVDFLKMDEQLVQPRTLKLKKLLSSYINVSRYIINYKKLEEIIQNGTANGEKLVLAIGLVNIENDDIRVNDEINYITESSIGNSLYYVIPIHGCSTNVFTTITKKIKANIIHMAGHGINEKGKKSICFTDSNMSYKKLCERIINNIDVLVLNCCYSYEYVEQTQTPFSLDTFVHEGEVYSSIAFEFSKTFFDNLWINKDVITAWNNARSVETPLFYHKL